MTSKDMNLLCLDIETAPHSVYTWGFWKQNISSDDQVEQPGYTLCVAYKWIGKGPVEFLVIQRKASGKPSVSALRKLWKLMTEADGIVTYNGDKFDLRTLDRAFMEAGLTPPAPRFSIDLYKEAARFNYPSRRMSYIARRLGVARKGKSPGFSTWLGCMAGLAPAWKKMERYNKQDVRVTEAILDKWWSWLKRAPNLMLVRGPSEVPACTRCGSEDVIKRGWRITKVRRYKQFTCKTCGHWMRARNSTPYGDNDKNILTT